MENARKKLEEKKLDMIVANDITSVNAGFQSPTNQVTFLFADGRMEALPLMKKSDVAELLMKQINNWFPKE